MEAARGEPQICLRDVEAGPETQRDERRPWRWVSVAIAVSLCVAAAVLLTSHMHNPDQSQAGSGMQLKLRQLAGMDKAAIHLEGVYNEAKTSDVMWSDNSGHAFFQGDLKLSNNEIVIPRSGLYFVYSQASFSVPCHAKKGDHDAGKMLHVSHAVECYSDSYENWKALLTSTRSACLKVTGGPDKRWHDAVYLGAVFSLLEGDRLRTVTGEQLLPSLELLDGKTFFGAFAL
ncbi:hypothetical protein SKAU_G00319000 [Synaphobranchus kaupii]|uniref:Lymphotoxin-alpha n=1 Tax=Synaphobranchus kaupii TaxID=118154 RepID=A0A9Q1IJD2_SYNKA|nr:hypothetical protein SKAU_G00319000 [Synaphobranchus kaupii]